MLTRSLKVTFTLLVSAAISAFMLWVPSASGACPCKGKTHAEHAIKGEPVADMPPLAEPGECYAKVFIQPQYRTVTERILSREASERVEIVPAKLDWVEERVMVQEPYRELAEVPAEYEWKERTVEVKSGHTDWVVEKNAHCTPKKTADQKMETSGEVYCLVTTPPVFKTIRTQCMVKPACVREVMVPAKFETVKRQRLLCKATVRKVCIPAEYETIERTVACSGGRMKWEHVVCVEKTKAETMNAVKGALLAAGYKPGPMNGKLEDSDWTALKQYQANNGLGVEALSYETMKKLGVEVQ